MFHLRSTLKERLRFLKESDCHWRGKRSTSQALLDWAGRARRSGVRSYRFLKKADMLFPKRRG